MVWAAGAYSLGIVAGVYAWRPAVWWLIAVAAFGAAAAYFGSRRSGVAWLLTLGTLSLASAFHIQMRSHLPGSTRAFCPTQIAGKSRSPDMSRDKAGSNPGGFGELRQTLDLEGEQVQTPDGPIVPVHSGIRVNIYSPRANEDVPADLALTSPLTQTFHYGDRIRFLAKLRPPRNFRNPGAFDYAGYLADRGIAALGSAKIENVELLPGFAGSRIERVRNRMHASVIAKVNDFASARGGPNRMPGSSARKHSLTAIRASTSSAPARTTSWCCLE
jgi:uncharacterized protein DUF4131